MIEKALGIDMSLKDDERKKLVGDMVRKWLESSVTYMHENYFLSAVEWYEDLHLYSGRRMIELTKQGQWRMCADKYPLIRSAYRTFSGMMSRLSLDKIEVESYDDNEDLNEYVEKYKTLQQYLLSRKETQRAWSDAINEALLVWAWYAKIETKEQTRRVTKWKKTQDVKIHYPHIKYLSYFDVIPDIAWDRFIAERSIVSKYELQSKRWIKDKDFEKFDTWKMLLTTDYNKVRNIQAYQRRIEEECVTAMDKYKAQEFVKLDNLPEKHDDYYTLWDNTLYEVVETYIDYYDITTDVWNTYLVIHINWEIYKHCISPHPFVGSPIERLDFELLPWQKIGRWIAQLWKPHQRKADRAHSSYLTSLLILNNPEFEQPRKPSDWVNNKVHIYQYRPWSIRPIETWQEFTLRPIQTINPNILQYSQNDIAVAVARFSEELWLSSYQTWWDGKVERTSAWVNEKKLAADNKIANFLQNINDFYTRIAEKFAIMYQANDYEWAIKIDGKEISTQDIVNWFKITFDWEDILWGKDQMFGKMMQWLAALAPFLWNLPKWFDYEEVVKEWLEMMWFESLNTSNEEKLKKLDDTIIFEKQRREKQAQIATWSPTDELKMSVSFSEPAIQQAIAQKLWLLDAPQPQAPVEVPQEDPSLQEEIITNEYA